MQEVEEQANSTMPKEKTGPRITNTTIDAPGERTAFCRRSIQAPAHTSQQKTRVSSWKRRIRGGPSMGFLQCAHESPVGSCAAGAGNSGVKTV